jgi:hypothetical protein
MLRPVPEPGKMPTENGFFTAISQIPFVSRRIVGYEAGHSRIPGPHARTFMKA